MMKKYGYIYKITHIPSGRYYIGQHKGETFDEKYWGSGVMIHRYVKKYPIEEFSREVLAWANSQEELNVLEEQFVGEKELKDENCMNLVSGGFCHIQSKEMRKHLTEAWTKDRKECQGFKMKSLWDESSFQKIFETEVFKKNRSEATKKMWKEDDEFKRKRKEIWNSEEFRAKQSEKVKRFFQEHPERKLTGKKNPMFGKKHSKERRKQQSERQFGRHWFNNGVINKFCYECPDGFMKGRL